jgi:TOBE domain-containing protein
LWVRVPPPELEQRPPSAGVRISAYRDGARAIAGLGSAEDGAREAVVARVVHLGFEVRVQLELEGEEPISAQVTRNEADRLELVEGGTVWVRTAARPAVPA